MRQNIRVGRLFGIDIGLHYSWFAVFALVTWSLGSVYFPTSYHSWSTVTVWFTAFVASVLFFGSVLGHELAHSIVAKWRNIEVESITLFIFGGQANITREADRARDEFAIAIAGPLASLLFGLLAAAFWIVAERLQMGTALQAPIAVAFWLAVINFLLAVFNLIPGFPMDGGRVLRSLVWGVTRNFWLATRVATGVGQVVAYAMIFGGLFVAISGSFFTAIWLIFVGWFLSTTAQASYRQAQMRENLRGVTVNQAMTRNYQAVSPYATLRQAFERYLRPNQLAAVPVVADDSRILGLLTQANVKQIPEDEWDYTRVNQVMTTLADAQTVTPQEEVTQVLTSLRGDDLGETPVVEDGQLVGLLTAEGITNLLRSRTQRRSDASP
ncbi:MAG: site-2 protease family protein [Dehalococcoidales bacterium]|nr:site-2 protease family protein [Dehalococcoidales bacterium]